MPKVPLKISSDARILVSNDDGIHAPGLKVLERVARSLSKDVWVIAPEAEQSGASHGLTLRRPLPLHKIGPQRFAVGGTPSDCVLMAVKHIIMDRAPDLVLSGVNRGANLGEDVFYSGTVAAAREAALARHPVDRLQPGAQGRHAALEDGGEVRAGDHPPALCRQPGRNRS